MDFAESTEHRDLRAAVAAIASGFGPKYYAQHAAERTPCDELWTKLGEAGFIGVNIPAEYGGLGGTFQTYVKVVEEVAKACASSALIIAVQELGALPILIGGSEEQKQRFIPKLASGEWVAA